MQTLTPTSLEYVAGPPQGGPRGDAQQPAAHSLGMIQALKRKVDAIRSNETALKQRLAQAEARCEELLEQLAAAKAQQQEQQQQRQQEQQQQQQQQEQQEQQQPAPMPANATHITESAQEAERQVQAAREEVARLQVSLAAALNANMAHLEATLALKREAKERVDRVMAEAEWRLQQQAELARERERVLLLEAGRLQQQAAHWEARARSLEVRMASASPLQAQGQEGRWQQHGQPQQQQQQQQQQQAAPGLVGVRPPFGIIRLGRLDSGGGAPIATAAAGAAGAAAAAAVGTATAPIALPLHGVVPADAAGSAQARGGGGGPAPRQPAAQQFGLPAHASPLDMLAAIASALMPVQPPRPAPKPRGNPLAAVHAPLKHVAPGSKSAASKPGPGRARKHPLPSSSSGAPAVQGANTVAAAHTAAWAQAGAMGNDGHTVMHQTVLVGTAAAPKRGPGRPRKHPLPPGKGGPPRLATGGLGHSAAVGAGTGASSEVCDEAHKPAPDPTRGRGRPPKPKPHHEGPAAAAAAAAGFTAGSGAGPGASSKRVRLNDDGMPMTHLAAATAAAAEQAQQPDSVPACGRAVVDPDGPGGGGGGGGQVAQEPTACITISGSSSDEAGSSGAAGTAEVNGPQACAAPLMAGLQGPCVQAGSCVTSDGGRSCSAGDNSTDTTPFSPSQVMVEVTSGDMARHAAHAGAAAATAARGRAAAVAAKIAATADGVKDGEPAGVDAAGGGGTNCGHPATHGCRQAEAPPAAPEAQARGAAGAATRAHVAPATVAPLPASKPAPAPAPAARCKPRMGLPAAEAVMRRLYLDVLAAARAVPGAVAAFEARPSLEQLPGFTRCVAEQDVMFFARIDARIGGRRTGFSRAAPLRYATPDALRADFARIMDNCHAYLSRAGGGSGSGGGGGSPVKQASRSVLDTAVAMLEAVDVQLEAVRASAELAEAMEAAEAAEHKLECRDCGKWRRMHGYGRFVQIRAEFSCGKLPGRACREPCDVCGAESDCECDD